MGKKTSLGINIVNFIGLIVVSLLSLSVAILTALIITSVITSPIVFYITLGIACLTSLATIVLIIERLSIFIYNCITSCISKSSSDRYDGLDSQENASPGKTHVIAKREEKEVKFDAESLGKIRNALTDDAKETVERQTSMKI